MGYETLQKVGITIESQRRIF